MDKIREDVDDVQQEQMRRLGVPDGRGGGGGSDSGGGGGGGGGERDDGDGDGGGGRGIVFNQDWADEDLDIGQVRALIRALDDAKATLEPRKGTGGERNPYDLADEAIDLLGVLKHWEEVNMTMARSLGVN